MKRQLQGAISIFLVLILIFGLSPFAPLLGVVANAASESDLTFSLINNGTEYEVKKCDTSAAGELVIPSTYNGLPVTSIGVNAFEDCDSLTYIEIPFGVTEIGYSGFRDCDIVEKIVIPNSVESIGSFAFAYSEKLTDLIIPNGVKKISSRAFSRCPSIKELFIPASVTEMEAAAFDFCENLKGITVSEDNDYYSSDSFGVLFNKDKTELLKFSRGSETTVYDIPDSVLKIGHGAFESCNRITSITIPDSVTSIEGEAFKECSKISSITIPGSISEISNMAFFNCAVLKEIILLDGVKVIGKEAFAWCVQLRNFKAYSLEIIGDSAFECCFWGGGGDLTLSDGIKSIGEDAFNSCHITNVIIGSTVTFIGESAFSDNDYLKSITVDPANEFYCSDSNGVLYNKDKSSLMQYPVKSEKTSFTIPNSVSCIEGSAFRGSYNLTEISLSENVTDIKDNAFHYCKNIINVNYSGTEEQKDKITVGKNNEYFTGANWNYNNVFVSDIAVIPEMQEIHVGETLQLSAVVSPDNATNKEYVWSSSNESVATVSESGLVTAISEGKSTITATTVDGNKTAVCVVSVSTEILHKTLEPENKSAGVEVDYPSGCFGVDDSKVTLRVENISQEKFVAQGDFRKIEGNMMIGLYNISPMDDMGNVIQPNCKVTVIIQAPHGYYDGDKVTVVHWRRDGKTEKFNAVVTNGIIEVQTDCFSEFGIYREMTFWEKIIDFFTSFFRRFFGN